MHKIEIKITKYGYVTTKIFHLDKRIYCPHCGKRETMWIDHDDYEDNAGDLCLCIACGFHAYGLEWGDEFVPPSNLHVARINAIKEQINA